MDGTEPKQHLRQLESTAEHLLDDYRRALMAYKQSESFTPLLGEVGERVFKVPARKVEKLVAPKGWELTQEYSALDNRFRRFLRGVKAFLDSVAKKTSSGYRRNLSRSLRPVAQAVHLDTKIKKLLGVLDGLETMELVRIEDIPRVRQKKSARRPGTPERDTGPGLPTEAVALGLISIFATVAGVLSVALYPTLGWWFSVPVGLVGAGLVVVGILVSRRFWVPAFRRVLTRH